MSGVPRYEWQTYLIYKSKAMEINTGLEISLKSEVQSLVDLFINIYFTFCMHVCMCVVHEMNCSKL